MARAGPSVAIDLGTTSILVGVWENNSVSIIGNEQGDRLIPSCVAFTDTGRLIGDAAKDQATRNVHNTVFGITRLVGRKFSDPELQGDIKRWPYKVICGPDNTPQVVVLYEGKRKALHPAEIVAMMLSEIRQALETRLNKEVRDVVLTVPACFNHAQRQAVTDAGAVAVAGFNVVRMISGSTAAAIPYGTERRLKETQQTVLVFDLGGGTLDVSLVAIEGDTYEVLATAGNTHLGGEDFDYRLVDHCVAEFEREYHEDLRTNLRAMVRLRMACEHTKRFLSASTEGLIELDSLVDGIDFHAAITRAFFESLCTDLFDKILQPVHQVLTDAERLSSKIDDVVLIGGSTRIPKIEQLLSDFFDDKVLSKSARSEEAAVYGATVLSAMLTEELSNLKSLDEFMVLDVVPLSLGVEIDGKNSTVMISRNTTIPTKKTRTFSTSEGNQSVMRIQLFEGENEKVSGNYPLGQLIVVDIAPKPRGESKIEVTLDIDANSSLALSIVDTSTGKKQPIRVDVGSLPPSEIEHMSKNVRTNSVVESKAKLENYAHSVRSSAAKRIAELKRSIEDIQAVEDKATETLRWLDSNHLTEFDVKRRKLEAAVNPITRNDG